MVQPWILTCPASQGIGLQLTRRLLATTKLPVVATARSDLEGARHRMLQGLDVDEKRLEVLQVDVTDEKTIADAAAHCESRFPSPSYLHLALCIPGILHPEKSPSQISYKNALDTFKINTLGPLLLAKYFSAFLPKRNTQMDPSILEGLPKKAIFAIMSARVGSISDNQAGGWYSYRASKAAVNQLVKTLDIHLKNAIGEKAMAVGLHPGTVKTGLSKDFWKSTPKEKLFEPGFAAEKLIDVLRGLDVDMGRGRCWDWKGTEIPP